MPHWQLAQHHPLKSSPSTQIKRLFIRLPLHTGVGIGTGRRRVDCGKQKASVEMNACPSHRYSRMESAAEKSN
jgi:hypothetical protein